MEFLAPFHPAIVHVPVALIVVGAIFELIGRATDLAWWRKAAFALLIVGVLGAIAAVLSGEQAMEIAEHRHGVPEDPIESHEDSAKLALWIGIGAVVARAAAGRTGSARGLVSGIGLTLHLAAAVMVGIAAYRGGKLVYEHAAGVKVNGQPVISGPPREHEEGK